MAKAIKEGQNKIIKYRAELNSLNQETLRIQECLGDSMTPEGCLDIWTPPTLISTDTDRL